MPHPLTFERELEDLINKYSQENGSNTPDFILAQFLVGCLAAWNAGVVRREQWYGRGQDAPATVPMPEPSENPPGHAG